MNANVRAMRPGDCEAVASLCDELGYPTTGAEVARRLALLLPRTDHRLLVGEQDGAVVGWIHVEHRLVLESDHWAEVDGLVVAQRARGRGIGRALLDAAERWSEQQGLRLVRLRSNVIRAAAHEFYRRRG